MKRRTWENVSGTPIKKWADSDFCWGSTQEVMHNGRKVLFAQVHRHNGNSYVVVPGYKIGEYYQLSGGGTAVDVEPIAVSDQPAIEVKIREVGSGYINFW